MSPVSGVLAVNHPGSQKILLCGYYGEHNLGDDALLQVLLEALPAGLSLRITARDPEPVRALQPDALIVNRRSISACLKQAYQADAVIFGGGSLLQDSTSVKSLIYYLLLIAVTRLGGGRVLLWGQGLGPLRRAISRWAVRSVLPLCASASWRDQTSYDLARRWAPAVPMCMAPDPVWQLPRRQWRGGGAIVLSWRPTPLLDDQGWCTLLSALDRLSFEVQAPVIWLAFHADQDGPLSDTLWERGLMSSRLRHCSNTQIVTSLQTVFSTVDRARLVLPMRLHALILARLGGCPMAALSYDPKVEAAAAMADVPCTQLSELPVADELVRLWRSAVDQPADVESTERIRSRASAHGTQLMATLQQ